MYEAFARIGYKYRPASHLEHVSGASQTIAAAWDDDVIVGDEAVDIDAFAQAPLDSIDIKLPGCSGTLQPLTEAVFLEWDRLHPQLRLRVGGDSQSHPQRHREPVRRGVEATGQLRP